MYWQLGVLVFILRTRAQFLGRELSQHSRLSLSPRSFAGETQDFKVNCRSPQTAGWRFLTLSHRRTCSHSLLCSLSKPVGVNLGLLNEGAPVIFFLPLSPFLSFCLNNNPQPVPHRSRASSSTLGEPRLESRHSTYHHSHQIAPTLL